MREFDSGEGMTAENLEAQLEAARDNLRGLDRSIRKILGRDPPDGENALQPAARAVQKRPMQPEDRRRSMVDFTVVATEVPDGKRRWVAPTGEPKTVFSRLSARIPTTADDSGDEDDGVSRPAVSSRVIATPREIPSRQEVIRRERVDERSRQRNKRMFGALLGTLQKFRQEETKLKAKEDKKAEVEARVEEAGRREKEELRRERQQLFQSRKRQQAEVRSLEAKLVRSRQFQEWRKSQLPLASFIRTKTQPAIFYLPKRKHPLTDSLLEASAKELREEIERQEKILTEDLEQIELQAGLSKQRATDANATAPVPEESLTPMEEGEENLDPNPTVTKVEKDDVPLPNSNNCEPTVPIPEPEEPVTLKAEEEENPEPQKPEEEPQETQDEARSE